MRGFLVLLLVLASLVRPASGFVSHETEKSREATKEKTLQQRETREHRESKGKRESEREAEGKRISKEEAIRRVLNMESGVSGRIDLGLHEIFLPLIAERERADRGIWGECRVAERPRLWAEFGVNFYQNGMLDQTGLQFFEQAARTRARIADALGPDVEKNIKSYVRCLVWYGAVIGAAGERLLAAIGEIGAGKRVGNVVRISDLGLDDLYLLADDALRRTEEEARKALSGAEENLARTRYGREILRLSMLDHVRCAFAGDVNRVSCGRYVLEVSAPPRLLIDGVLWFGEQRTGWIEAKISVSSSFSLSKALEELKKTDEFRETAEQVERYAEKLEAEGKAVEAVRLRRRALKLMTSGKTRIDPSSLISLQ